RGGAVFFGVTRGDLLHSARVESSVGASAHLERRLGRRHISAFDCICQGGPTAGPIGQLPLLERWRWLTAPRSTIIQTSPAHGGLSVSLDTLVRRIINTMVRT